MEKLTFVLCVIGGFQYWAFVQSEQAFVAPTHTDFAIKDTVGVKLLPMYLELSNSGKSPATIDELRVAITHKLPLERQYGKAPNYAFPPVMPGGSTKQQLELKFETEWGEKTADAVKTGEMPFYIFGRIKYHDDIRWWWRIFGPRVTGFCFIHTPTSSVASFQTCSEPAYTYSR